jgi:hypothetical protein
MSAGSAGVRHLRAILREPLLHFALGGALLFLAYYHYAPQPPPAASKEIVITEANLAAFRSELAQLYQRPPNQVELNGLIQDYIQTEVLYREALALGLDSGDLVVRRRMEQKMRFLIEDTTHLPPATDAELGGWLEAHRTDFDEPARVRFSQVFVSRDLHGDGSEALAAKLRADLAGDTPEQAATIGDAFPAGFDFDLLTERDLVRYFGADFAAAVMSLPEGSWSHPLASTYGLHLVWIREQVPGQHVTLDAVRERVRYAFDEERHRQANEARFAELRSRYTIEMPHTSMASEP